MTLPAAALASLAPIPAHLRLPGCRCRPAGALHRPAARNPVRPRVQGPRVQALLGAAAAGRKGTSEEGVVLPLNYAELLGLCDVKLPLHQAVEGAYEELMNAKPLEEGYSELARLGKEKILKAARDRLLRSGRTSLLSPTVQVEPLLLPGAMALLHQLRRYELVIQLSEEGAALSTREMRSSSRDTIKEFEQDMALATALAQCGLADRALQAGQHALACSRLEEALKLLTDAPTAGGGGGMLRGRGAGAAAGARQLAPRLQADIHAALAEFQPDAVADYLQVPLDRAQHELRAREVGTLRRWVAAPAAAARPDGRPILTPEYMERVVPRLTSAELCGLYDWQGLAASGSSVRCPWYFPGLLQHAALAHLVVGVAERRPLLVATARKLFATVHKSAGGDGDTALPLAVSELLLGHAAAAQHLLEEDEKVQQQHLAQQKKKQRRGGGAERPSAATAGSSATAYAAGGSKGPEGRHAIMRFVREHTPLEEPDVRSGLARFASWWLQAVAYPQFQDTAMGATPPPNLDAYFGDLRVQAFLAAQQDGEPEGGLLSVLSSAQSALLARLAGPGVRQAPALPSSAAPSSSGVAGSSEKQLPGQLDVRGALPWLAGAAALAALALYGIRSSGGVLRLWPGSPVPPETAEAAAAIGLPLQALRPHHSAQWEQQQPAQGQREAGGEQQRQAAVISRDAARRLVQSWLAIKAEAMGPRHNTERLSEVLAEPMLSAVTQEAEEAAETGWFWNIRQNGRCKVDSIDASAFRADGGGHVTAVATVHERADLWASNGKQADSYRTEYQVEYTLVKQSGAWRIAAALVLGK